MWYVMQACAALNVTLDEVIEENVEKLKKRYPGDFDVHTQRIEQLTTDKLLTMRKRYVEWTGI